ncbi:hypothetical protein [Desulfocicer vacuolatum]|nr:hypothetical protein [Desulfocicer vacuolatum]
MGIRPIKSGMDALMVTRERAGADKRLALICLFLGHGEMVAFYLS